MLRDRKQKEGKIASPSIYFYHIWEGNRSATLSFLASLSFGRDPHSSLSFLGTKGHGVGQGKQENRFPFSGFCSRRSGRDGNAPVFIGHLSCERGRKRYPFNFHTQGPFLFHIVSFHTKRYEHFHFHTVESSISILFWSQPFYFYTNTKVTTLTKTFSGISIAGCICIFARLADSCHVNKVFTQISSKNSQVFCKRRIAYFFKQLKFFSVLTS